MSPEIARGLQHFIQQQFGNLVRLSPVFVERRDDGDVRLEPQVFACDFGGVEHSRLSQRRGELRELTDHFVDLAFGRVDGPDRLAQLPPFRLEFGSGGFECSADTLGHPSECRPGFRGEIGEVADVDRFQQVLAQVDGKVAELLGPLGRVLKAVGHPILTLQLGEIRLAHVDAIEIDPRQDAVGGVIPQPMRERRPPSGDSEDQDDQEQQANRQTQRNVTAAELPAQACRPRTVL